MSTKTLSFRTLPNLAISEGATTPNVGTAGVWAWSTSLNKPVFWNGVIWSAGSSGGSSVTTSGTALIDFGVFPGSNEATVNVTGQGSISSTSKVHVFIQSDATSTDHTASDHQYLSVFVGLSTSLPVNSTGFSIYARSLHKLQGTYTLNWFWTD